MKKGFSKKDAAKALDSQKTAAENVLGDSKKTEHLTQKAISMIGNIPGIGKYVNEIKYMCEMVKDYAKREYTEVKISAIITVAASLVYLVTPIDIIPDYIPIVGYLDDMAVLAYAIKTTHKEIEAYKLWKNMKNLKDSNTVDESFDDIGKVSAAEDNTADSDDVVFDDAAAVKPDEDWDASAYDDGFDK